MTILEPPSQIAILGAGPAGVEAALYARYLGYAVRIFEKGGIGQHLRWIREHAMWGPFETTVTPLGLSALQAQDPTNDLPAPHATLTIGEWLDRYLIPLAATDLLADSIWQNAEVIRVTVRDGADWEDEEATDRFRVTLEPAEQSEFDCAAVIDSTGRLPVSADEQSAYDVRLQPAFELVGAESAPSPLPHYHVIGIKSLLGDGQMLRATHGQIRELFAKIGDRSDLNLYSSFG